MTAQESLRALLETRRVVIAVGAGGVGKTTTAAALGVAAARAGKRVLCLTIDPAKRLAESLGLREMTTEAAVVDAARFEAAGAPMKGRLTVMMLDTKRTFDDLVRRFSSTPDKAERLLNNKLYKYVSTSLAGTQEYMAMEKLIAVRGSDEYDLIVLDTPPTTNALDFLDAPDKLIDALDSSTLKWFVDAFQTTGKLSLNLLARGAAVVLRGIGKLTGGGFLEDMAEFITELNDLFGGFRQRAAAVHEALRARDVTFVLVTSPEPMSVREVVYFSDRLREHEMPRGALVVNRVHVPPAYAEAKVDEKEIARVVKGRGVALEDDAPARIAKAHADAGKLAALDARHLAGLAELVGSEVPVVRVPEMARDVYDVGMLVEVAERLVGEAEG